jgi:glycine/D-amino acid oxidase-like deaminating enzyme
MAADLDGDIGVDVLVIGAGIQGLYLARSLSRRYSVCVLSDPAVESETLQSPGYISAGYDGNDVTRVQPARRAAGYWRLWAESNGLAHDYSSSHFVVGADEQFSRPALWTDAQLPFSPAPEVPPIFAGGSIADDATYVIESDVVINPAAVINKLRDDLDDCFLTGSVLRFGLAADAAVDHVQVEVDDRMVPIVPRFVVLAAGVGNATLLSMIGKRFNEQARRAHGQELARSSQAVQRSYLLCVRGPGLPLISGWYGGFSIVSHPLTASDENVWLVAPPIDDGLTTLGPDDLRFEPKVDPAVVRDSLDRLFAMSPELERMAPELRWSCYAARRAQHPMLATSDSSLVAQPVPAKLDAFGLEGLLALWPSHLGYAMVLGDVVVERIEAELGGPGDFGTGVRPGDLSLPLPPARARWDRDNFPWRDWGSFAARYEFNADPARVNG